jgi:hypothetical protein
MQTALEKCVPLMKAEEVRLARLIVVDDQLRQSGRYPAEECPPAICFGL